MHCHGDGRLCKDALHHLMMKTHSNEALVAGNGYQGIVTRRTSSSWINRDENSLGIDGVWAWLIEHDIQIARSESLL